MQSRPAVTRLPHHAPAFGTGPSICKIKTNLEASLLRRGSPRWGAELGAHGRSSPGAAPTKRREGSGVADEKWELKEVVD